MERQQCSTATQSFDSSFSIASRLGWSPEQVSFQSRDEGVRIGVVTIYRFIHAQIACHKDYSWRKYLPRAKAKRGIRPSKGGSPALHMS